ncbi:MAG: glycosyltransferase family 9 protein [Bacteroidota bacterium]
MKTKTPTIILSRTDNLGDVILTLPMAGLLRCYFPQATLYFIGKSYTAPLITGSRYVDHFLDREALLADPQKLKELKADTILFVFPDKPLAQLAKQAKIPLRIGTSHRVFHWFTCNQLVHFSRKRSSQHEAQLNLKLLKPLSLPTEASLVDFPAWYGLQAAPLAPVWKAYLSSDKFNLILHPKSKGSAREWGLENYEQLAKSLSPDRFQLFITGSPVEKALIYQEKPSIFQLPHVTDLTGKFTLEELMSFINEVDGLLACSTGPLHIAAALGKYALGLYPTRRPMHPGRWQPLGKKASYLCLDKACQACRKSGDCACILAISVARVKATIEKWEK